MAAPAPPPPPAAEPPRLKIYLLPNLMTAGNLFCGFLALTRVVEADLTQPGWESSIRAALFLILLACIFDLLDGRVARLGGHESPFGREFDSLADVVSFGAAPAFLVHRIVLKDVFVNHQEVGWFIASVYLICGAFRLARFNVLATMAGGGGGKEFTGFPIPAAAGMVASLTLLLLWIEEKDFPRGILRLVLPALLVVLSIMMVSEVRYPAFKSVNWRTSPPFQKMVAIILVIGLFVILWQKILPVALPILFTAYLLYGFVRPYLSRRMRREIERDDEDDHEHEAPAAGPRH
jgi:CDP-diacylglycerol--serine O-phosphatidyltransferase